MKAVICPVCNGSGKYNDKECHGCNGKGWVTIGTDYPVQPIYPIQPIYPYPPYAPYWETTWGDETTW